MSKLIGWCSVLLLLVPSSELMAKNSDLLASIASLQEHGSVAAFEQSISDAKQTCFANAPGDSARMTCFIESDLWQREMEWAFARLSERLAVEERALLEVNQKAWQEYRSSQQKVDTMLMPKEYRQTGSMYLALRAEYTNNTQASVFKQRALHLHRYLKAAEGTNRE